MFQNETPASFSAPINSRNIPCFKSVRHSPALSPTYQIRFANLPLRCLLALRSLLPTHEPPLTSFLCYPSISCNSQTPILSDCLLQQQWLSTLSEEDRVAIVEAVHLRVLSMHSSPTPSSSLLSLQALLGMRRRLPTRRWTGRRLPMPTSSRSTCLVIPQCPLFQSIHIQIVPFFFYLRCQ